MNDYNKKRLDTFCANLPVDIESNERLRRIEIFTKELEQNEFEKKSKFFFQKHHVIWCIIGVLWLGLIPIFFRSCGH